jgi:excisionase family DNA binding protein
MGQQLEKLLTPSEAASLLGVRLKTLYTWASRRQVPAQRVGRCLRFSPAALSTWLAAQRRPVGWPDDEDAT